MINKRTFQIVNDGAQCELVFCFCSPGKYRVTRMPKYAVKNTTIEISKGFWMQDITVSIGLYEFVYGRPYYEHVFSDADKFLYPLDAIDFSEVEEFLIRINKIVAKNGYAFEFSLPSLVEWEHALLCNNDAAWSWRDDDSLLTEHAWYRDNSKGSIHLSRERKPNDWGLYDMYGNVMEYCYDNLFDDKMSFFLDPKIVDNPNHDDALPCLGGYYDSTSEQCNGFKSVGYCNQFMETTGFRLVIREDSLLSNTP